MNIVDMRFTSLDNFRKPTVRQDIKNGFPQNIFPLYAEEFAVGLVHLHNEAFSVHHQKSIAAVFQDSPEIQITVIQLCIGKGRLVPHIHRHSSMDVFVGIILSACTELPSAR